MREEKQSSKPTECGNRKGGVWVGEENLGQTEGRRDSVFFFFRGKIVEEIR